ncbi:LysR family transcriptional regulator [Cupriavidus alkaliphilus]|uniref:LysR family transcriptional regulator n=1 Tax=Cupriavidus alkaliphilus TaxID=942866 RepID=UPI00161B8864|nr:LysR family transcriptional regulator [Cupriavidus alkaliphilus]MBB2919977.1 DNA-binding transcriptional LysR family regulator [Cupriavidus alkaliphilus]
MDRLTAMNVFCRVVERGSFTVAAERLDMSTASVSKYVSALESHIGTPLLARTTRRIVLTEAGKNYYEKCTRILDEIEDAERSAGVVQTVPRGLLKVRAPVSLGNASLGRTVAEFTARFPEVSVEMTLNDRFVDPAEEGVDVAFYIATTPKGSAEGAHPIAAMPRLLVAAPGYVSHRGLPLDLADLARHSCLVYTRGIAPNEWRFTREGEESAVHVTGAFRCNHSLTLREAVLDGAGICLLPAFLVIDDLAAGRLCTILPDWCPQARTLYAAYPQPRRASPKVREFVSLVSRRFDFGSSLPAERQDA